MSNLNLDWSKLSQPQLFFGLAENFELEDLKKIYKSYIKVYKPDIYPEEFKKIRKAYEELVQKIENINFEKLLAKSEAEVKESEVSNTQLPNVSPFSHQDFTDLESVKEYLRSLPLTPRTCLYWANFSDVAPGNNTHFYWLIRGVQLLEAQDYYYGAFIAQFVRSCQAEASWLELLTELTANVTAPIFYHYLYPIFNQMIKDLNTEQVIQCLLQCEKNLVYKGEYLEEKQGLYLALLGKAILTKKPEIYAPLVEFLENYKSRMPDDLYNALEFHLNLIDYFKLRNDFITKYELCIKLDQLILTFIELDEEKCRKLILEIKAYFKTEVKYDSHYHSEQFNLYGLPTYKVIRYIFEDIDHLLTYKEFDDNFKIKRVKSFNQVVNKAFEKSSAYSFFLPCFSYFNRQFLISYLIIVLFLSF